VFGVAGDGHECDLALTWPDAPAYGSGDPNVWLTLEFVPRLRGWLRDNHCDSPVLDVLAGVGGRLLGIERNGAVYAWPEGFGAIGCAADLAIGALAMAGRYKPRTRMRRALELSAKRYPSDVAPPWNFVRG